MTNEGRFQVLLQDYDDLTEEEKECVPENGSGAECAYYLRVIHNGKTIRLESDAMEKEDAIFYRDLSWISSALEEAYKAGLKDAGQ